MFSIRKGVMWLVVATIAEVPPAVGSASSLAHALVVHHLGTLQVLIILDLNGIFFAFGERCCIDPILP